MIVVAGGVMPDEDVVALKKMGVSEVMLQDTPPQAIIETLPAARLRTRTAMSPSFPRRARTSEGMSMQMEQWSFRPAL